MYKLFLQTYDSATLRPLCEHDAVVYPERDDRSFRGSRCETCGAKATRGPASPHPGRNWIFEGPDGAEESAGRLLDQRHAGDRA